MDVAINELKLDISIYRLVPVSLVTCCSCKDLPYKNASFFFLYTKAALTPNYHLSCNWIACKFIGEKAAWSTAVVEASLPQESVEPVKLTQRVMLTFHCW